RSRRSCTGRRPSPTARRTSSARCASRWPPPATPTSRSSSASRSCLPRTSSPEGFVTVPQAFPPTLREVMLRPRWLGVLGLCLVVAGVFAFLGQWQLGRAIDTDPPAPGATEQVRPLEDVAEPGEYLPEPLVGQRVSATGEWMPGDFIVVASRFNDGAEGYWVTGQLRVAERTSIAVALGWAPDLDS